jgi:hypothetical protein
VWASLRLAAQCRRVPVNSDVRPQMQLSGRELGPAFLAELGEEARRLLYAGDIDTLAARFGYALALGRDPADAISDELSSCLRETASSQLIAMGWEAPRVSYFKPNDMAVCSCGVLSAHREWQVRSCGGHRDWKC